jgi:hypothetical protein
MQGCVKISIAAIALVIVYMLYNREYFNRRLAMPRLRFPPGGNCTDGCIYRIRNQGVYVDTECQNMCRNNWNEKGYYEYMDSLKDSVNSGAYVYMYGV